MHVAFFFNGPCVSLPHTAIFQDDCETRLIASIIRARHPTFYEIHHHIFSFCFLHFYRKGQTAFLKAESQAKEQPLPFS